MIQWMLAIWSLVHLPFLNPAWTSGCSVFTYCWSLTWRILSNIVLASEMSAIVQQFEHSLAPPFFGIGMKTDLFLSCGHGWVFQIWVFPVEAQVSGGLPWRQVFWLQRTWEAQSEPHHRATKQTAHKLGNNDTKKSSHCCGSSRAHSVFPNLGSWQRDWEPPGNMTLKASGIWWQLPQDWRNRVFKGANKTLCAPGPRRKEQWPHKRLSQACPWVSGVSGRGVGRQCPALGSGALNTIVLEL